MSPKKSLRQQIKALLAAQSMEERDSKSRVIQKKLFETPAFKSAGTVCFYVGLPMEVNTRPMIKGALKLGKRVLAPLVDLENKELKLKEIHDLEKDLSPGTLGILEPSDKARTAELHEVECLIVPALAFDKEGCRLGRGAGFYDRLLARLPQETVTIGLAFSFQVLPQIPLEKHDHPVKLVLTEK